MTRWTLWQAFKCSYISGAAFVRDCPLLALVPMAFEMLQHIAEVRIGMYDSLAAAQAADSDPVRMWIGFLKAVMIVAPGYWIVRFLWRRDPDWARSMQSDAVRPFSAYLLFQAAFLAIEVFAVPHTLPGEFLTAALAMLVSALTPAWGAAAALGNPGIGLARSARLMAPRLPWTLALGLAVVLPLMIPHYMFAAFAIMAPKTTLWPLLAVDAALVSYMTAVTAAGGLYAALRAADLGGVSLLPGEQERFQGTGAVAPLGPTGSEA
jgi:hypothetical protein